jgi:hypothetical protein
MGFTQHSDHLFSDLSHSEMELVTRIVHAVRGTRFGSVTLTLHEGKVVEIHKTEKIRVGK